jgi:hypothetical protein
MLMDGEKIDGIRRFLPPGCRHDFIGGKVDRVDHLAEKLVFYCREKAKIAIGDPFKVSAFMAAANFGGIDRGFAALPYNIKPLGLQGFRVFLGGMGNTFFAIMENVDIFGKALPFTV